jgi:ZIP family zinc transporter
MLSDFVPEALALGATFVVSKDAGFLLAGIIALQIE